jgi:hypothetical protein
MVDRSNIGDADEENQEEENIPETYSVIEQKNYIQYNNKQWTLPSYEDICPPSYEESLFYPQIKISFLPDTDFDLNDFYDKEDEIITEKKRIEIERKTKEKQAGEQLKRYNKQMKYLDDLSKSLFKYNKILSEHRETILDTVNKMEDFEKKDEIIQDVYFKVANTTLDKLIDWRDQPIPFEDIEAETLKRNIFVNYSNTCDILAKWMMVKSKSPG